MGNVLKDSANQILLFVNFNIIGKNGHQSTGGGNNNINDGSASFVYVTGNINKGTVNIVGVAGTLGGTSNRYTYNNTIITGSTNIIINL